jgi:hypothetical protein
MPMALRETRLSGHDPTNCPVARPLAALRRGYGDIYGRID